MESNELKAIVESLIFVSEEPITERQILEALDEAQVSKEELDACIEAIKETTNNDSSRGLQLVEVAGGYQFRTKEPCGVWIQKLNIPKPVRLSQPALETLSIIAYRQPIVRSEIESIRGVDVGGVLKTLLERDLIRIIGRRDEPGQPLIYGTSSAFLELFGLNSLSELPPLTDIEELARRQVETDAAPKLSLIKGDDEEPTEIMEDEEDEEEEEETEVIRREEEDEDEEVLKGVERDLKDLRRLEKEIFPKDEEKKEEGAGGETAEQAAEQTADQAAAEGADAAPKDDSQSL